MYLLLKKQSSGYRSKKSKILTGENVSTFLNEAPDKVYLPIKVATIMGMAGGCRTVELVHTQIGHIIQKAVVLFLLLPFQIRKSKSLEYLPLSTTRARTHLLTIMQDV